MQDTAQAKCTGLLFFDVNGNIKACPFFHFARHNVADGPLPDLVTRTRRDWCSVEHAGECPVYADPRHLAARLESLGWRHLAPGDEEYLCDPRVAQVMMDSYAEFLRLKASRRPGAAAGKSLRAGGG
jgi:hypothetical protein